MDKRFFVPSRNRHYKIPEDKLAEFMRVNPDAVPAETPAAPPAAAAPSVPAAPAAAPAAPAEEGGMMRNLAALATGAGRGLTADFLDEIAGAAAAAGAKFGGEGVAPEFLAQEDFYAQGREEEQARQAALAKESPLLTLGGQIVGSLPYAAMAPTGAATFAGRVAQAAPSAAAYGAATGVGRTDIFGTPDTAKETAAELAKNVGVDVGAGLLGAAGGAAVGTAASSARAFLARKLAEIGAEADLARVATAGKKAVESAKKGMGGVDVKETARVMRATGLGGVQTPKAIQAKAQAVEEEAGGLIGRIVSEVDAASGGFLKKAEDARAAAAVAAERNDFISWEQLSREAEQAEAAAASRRVSGDEVAKRLESQANELMAEQGATSPGDLDELTSKTYKKLIKAADQMRGRTLSLAEAQGRLRPLAITSRFESGAPDVKVTASAKGARGESRAIREQMDVAAEEALPPGGAMVQHPLALVGGRAGPPTQAPGGREAYQSARRVYDVMQDIIPSAEKEAARFKEMSIVSPARYLEPYAAGVKARGMELAQTAAPQARTALLSPQERILASLPYGAESFADMLRQIDEESRP